MNQRIYKFRAWNTQEKCMLWRGLFDMNWYRTEKNDDLGSHCWGPISGGQKRFLKIMQFTGLKDKNGKEIYEGDVVKRVYRFTRNGKPMENIDEIVFMESWGAFAFHSKTNIGLGWSRMYDGHKVFPFEIIGNIYENPELLTNPQSGN